MDNLLAGLHAKQKAVIVAIALSLSFALMGVWVRMMGDSFDDFQQTYLRVLLAGVMALIIFRRRLSSRLFSSLSRKEWMIYSVRAVMAYVFGVAVFTVAIQNAELSVVSFISTVPILGVLAYLFFREKLPRSSIPFLFISTAGVFLLTGASFGAFHLGLGELASIVAALGFNIGFLMSRLHKKERNNYDNTTVLLLIGWIPVFIISIALQEAIIPSTVSFMAIVGLLLSAFFNIIGLYATNYIFTHLKAYVAGNILLLEGVWAVVIGMLLYGEPLTVSIAIGGMLIIASAVAINKINNKSETVQTDVIDERS